MGRINCCGRGPVDPDLMRERADRQVCVAKHVAYFRKKGRPPEAHRIVEGMLAVDVCECRMEFGAATEIAFDSPDYISMLAGSYDGRAERLARPVGVDVIVLYDSDPYVYGSFMHLHAPLQGREVIACILGCWNAVGQPIRSALM